MPEKGADIRGRLGSWCLLPSCVYGPGGTTFTELPAKLASEGSFAWISDGQGIANYVFVDNLIDADFAGGIVDSERMDNVSSSTMVGPLGVSFWIPLSGP